MDFSRSGTYPVSTTGEYIFPVSFPSLISRAMLPQVTGHAEKESCMPGRSHSVQGVYGRRQTQDGFRNRPGPGQFYPAADGGNVHPAFPIAHIHTAGIDDMACGHGGKNLSRIQEDVRLRIFRKKGFRKTPCNLCQGASLHAVGRCRTVAYDNMNTEALREKVRETMELTRARAGCQGASLHAVGRCRTAGFRLSLPLIKLSIGTIHPSGRDVTFRAGRQRRTGLT